mgnify:FL=1
MENEHIIIKGIPKKNKVALILLLSGVAVALISFFVAWYCFNRVVVPGYRWWLYCEEYDYHFFSFFFEQFFSSCFYGYTLTAGIIIIVAGLFIKVNTEKCEITVTNKRIFGKPAHNKEVDIPWNQITGLHSCFFDGISIASIGNICNFYCMENHEEVMKAISYILANPQGMNVSSTRRDKTSTTNSSTEKSEQLIYFKSLFDNGIITQEEFNAKKKEILGL